MINCGQLKGRRAAKELEGVECDSAIVRDLLHVTQSLALIIRLLCWPGQVNCPNDWPGLFKSRFQVQTMAALIDAAHQREAERGRHNRGQNRAQKCGAIAF